MPALPACGQPRNGFCRSCVATAAAAGANGRIWQLGRHTGAALGLSAGHSTPAHELLPLHACALLPCAVQQVAVLISGSLLMCSWRFVSERLQAFEQQGLHSLAEVWIVVAASIGVGQLARMVARCAASALQQPHAQLAGQRYGSVKACGRSCAAVLSGLCALAERVRWWVMAAVFDQVVLLHAQHVHQRPLPACVLTSDLGVGYTPD